MPFRVPRWAAKRRDPITVPLEIGATLLSAPMILHILSLESLPSPGIIHATTIPDPYYAKTGGPLPRELDYCMIEIGQCFEIEKWLSLRDMKFAKAPLYPLYDCEWIELDIEQRYLNGHALPYARVYAVEKLTDKEYEGKLREIFAEMEKSKLDGSWKTKASVDFDGISGSRPSPIPSNSKLERVTNELCEDEVSESGKRKARKARRVRRASVDFEGIFGSRPSPVAGQSKRTFGARSGRVTSNSMLSHSHPRSLIGAVSDQG